MNKTSYQVSDASIKRYQNLRNCEEYKYDSWKCFKDWARMENFSKGGAYWDAMRIICGQDKAFLREAIFSYQLADEKLNKLAEAFEIINDLNANNQ